MIRYIILRPLLWMLAKFNVILKHVFGYSLYSGKCSEKSKSFKTFESSAHRCKVLFNARPFSIAEVTLDHFLLSHVSYEDPRECIAKNKNVTLMNIDGNFAIFGVVEKDFDVYDSKHGPFVFSVQGDNSLEVITVPIKFLLPLAEFIKSKEGKDPDIAIMWNPGRCGSTLLSQMMEPIPDLVTMSEPDFITADIRKREFQTYSQFDVDKDPFLYGKFLLACLIIQCKGMFHKSVVIKPRSMALTNLKYLKGQPEDFGSLYFDVKHMFLYREPVKNIVSILSMAGSMPNFLARQFMSKFLNPIIEGLSPDVQTKQMAFDHVNKGVKEGDGQVTGIVIFILHILCFLKGKGDTDIKPHTIKYENVLANPREELEKIGSFLGKKNDRIDYEKCLEAMKKDSQEKSEVLSKEKLAAEKKKNPINQDLIDKVDKYFLDYGLPKTKEFDNLFH